MGSDPHRGSCRLSTSVADGVRCRVQALGKDARVDNRILIADERSEISIAAAGRTETGPVRAVNEDSLFSAAPVFAVADGLGGHHRGDLASRAMVEQLGLSVRPGRPTAPDAIFTAITAANATVRAWSTRGGIAGTTIAGVALVSLSTQIDLHWMVFNIGDSRVYLRDERGLRQVTVDHSAVQELLDDGSITREQAAAHPDRNVVTRAVGVEDDADPDVWLIPVSGRQTFVICSDGLTRDVSEAEIVADLDAGPENAASALVERAIRQGSRDNVTVVVVDAVSTDTGPHRPGYADDRALGVLEETLPRT
ncbi:serine/threonine-protein phosphatase [Labedella populi]|uniref:Serine/threonine-protein phosphatase n=1 Tax=Labedella populi TaxID=2498850 RepID=A0A3S4ANY5_9MICO|nr:serine/threonine-protein phosphatase [Labedella populi]